MPVRILIVEDERLIARGLEKRLLRLGYQVLGLAGDGEEAIAFVQTQHPDLILMDISLGAGMDGIETATRIQRMIDVPVVYLTAYSDQETLDRAKMTGPLGYILKPVEDKDLHTAIEIGIYRHEMEKQLRENEQWLATVLASIGDAVIATDATGRVRFLNPLAEHLTGWTRLETYGRNVEEVMSLNHQDSNEPVKSPIHEAIEKNQIVGLAPDTILRDRKGGTRAIDDSSAPIHDKTGQVAGAVMVFRDITERKKLEERLRQAQKMEALGRLAGGIAHDFNNIMTIITGYSEILQNEMIDPNDRRAYLKEITEASRRAASLTQQILAFSRKQILVARTMNLNDVIQEMQGMLQRLIGVTIDLKLDLEKSLVSINADATQIWQVILNLAINARDAMPHGGHLKISTRTVELDESTSINDPQFLPGIYAELTISDTGCGMTAETLEHLFEPFFTTKGIGKGTGLGLATVHGIVHQSRGLIRVESQLGHGSQFHLYFPRCASVELSTPITPVSNPIVGNGSILVVEDEEPLRKLMRMILERNGFGVLEAASGIEAIETLQRAHESIRLVISDLIMPKMTGRELWRVIQLQFPSVRVLFTSGYSSESLIKQGFDLERDPLLSKPFTVQELTERVKEILARSPDRMLS